MDRRTNSVLFLLIGVMSDFNFQSVKGAGTGGLGLGEVPRLDSLVNPDAFKDLFSGILDLNNSPLGKLLNNQGGPLNDLNGENGGMGGLLGSLANLLPDQGKKLGLGKGDKEKGGFLGIVSGMGNTGDNSASNKVLGDNCTSAEQCLAPFSGCEDGVCACLDGFTQGADNETCASQEFHCPMGNPLLGSNLNVIGCTRDIIPGDKPCPTCTSPALGQLLGLGLMNGIQLGGPALAGSWEDSCPTESYCATYDVSQSAPKARYFGHCCPLPDLQCPIGPSLNVSCEECPTSTHYCHQISLGQYSGVHLGTCCPKACKSANSIFKDGKCWDRAGKGDACVVDAQCVDKNTACKGGVCRCIPGAMNLYGECQLVSCPLGNKPRLNLNQEIVKCSNSSACGQGGFCWQELDICCPIPEMRCPQAEDSSAAIRECDVRREAVDKKCGKKETCVDFYRPIEIGQGGVCCRLQKQ